MELTSPEALFMLVSIIWHYYFQTTCRGMGWPSHVPPGSPSKKEKKKLSVKKRWTHFSSSNSSVAFRSLDDLGPRS
jgi:hypothetical protein